MEVVRGFLSANFCPLWSPLVDDVTTSGTCDILGNPAPDLDIWGWSHLPNDCAFEVETIPGGSFDLNGNGVIEDFEIVPDYNITKIAKGTCSDATEALFRIDACLKSLAEQPNIIRQTLELLVQYSCTEELFLTLPFSEFAFRQGGKRSHKDTRTTTKLAPVIPVA